MREGFDLGVRVMPRRRGSVWKEGTLSAGKQAPGWVNPAYNGEGWYFVKWDGDDKLYVVREEDIEISEVIRYVITNMIIMAGGATARTLTFPAQGRYTYATKEEAEERLKLFELDSRTKRILSPKQASTLEVRPCRCWPGHFDPRGIYFD